MDNVQQPKTAIDVMIAMVGRLEAMEKRLDAVSGQPKRRNRKKNVPKFKSYASLDPSDGVKIMDVVRALVAKTGEGWKDNDVCRAILTEYLREHNVGEMVELFHNKSDVYILKCTNKN